MVCASDNSQKMVDRRFCGALSETVLALDAKLRENPYDGALWMERAAVLPEQKLMREAMESLSRAIVIDPTCGIYYRWRGHRHLNLGEIPEACADFVVASRLIPDNWDVWYHLGLCHVLMEHYTLAELAYRKCREVTPSDPESDIALNNWTWIALMHQGKRAEAQAILDTVDPQRRVEGSNINYFNLLLLYKGVKTPEELLARTPGLEGSAREDEILDVCTQAFGLANYYKVNGMEAAYEKTLDFLLDLGEDDAWNCFGWAGASYVRRRRKRAAEREV